MQFSKLTITVGSAQQEFLPFDRGANGAFVYRNNSVSVFAPRVVVSSTTNDAASDKLTVQLNTPRVAVAAEGCCDIDKQIGTDLVKTEMRFLASTSKTDRIATIDTHIALLEELRAVIQDRETIYS